MSQHTWNVSAYLECLSILGMSPHTRNISAHREYLHTPRISPHTENVSTHRECLHTPRMSPLSSARGRILVFQSRLRKLFENKTPEAVTTKLSARILKMTSFEQSGLNRKPACFSNRCREPLPKILQDPGILESGQISGQESPAAPLPAHET